MIARTGYEGILEWDGVLGGQGLAVFSRSVAACHGGLNQTHSGSIPQGALGGEAGVAGGQWMV